MSRTHIPKHLIHNSREIETNANLFDILVDLMPEGIDKELRQIAASALIEKIRQAVNKEGFFKLPFNLVVREQN